MLGFTLSEEQLAIQKTAREFAEKEINPVASQFEKDEEGRLAEDIFKKAAEMGINYKNNCPGLSFGKPLKKMGMDADRNSEIFFDDVRVPKENLLGKVGDGAGLLQRSLI